MSESIGLMRRLPDSSYTVSYMDGCRIITGGVPLSDMEMLISGFSENAISDSLIASQIGAAFVFGEPDAITELRKNCKIVSESRLNDARYAALLNLPESAVEWLKFGERGLSSNAICQAIYGIPNRQTRTYTEHPCDPSDLRRCLLFLDASGAYKNGEFRAVVGISTEWQRLYANWAEIVDCYYEEIAVTPNEAPKTFALMTSVIAGEPI